MFLILVLFPSSDRQSPRVLNAARKEVGVGKRFFTKNLRFCVILRDLVIKSYFAPQFGAFFLFGPKILIINPRFSPFKHSVGLKVH